MGIFTDPYTQAALITGGASLVGGAFGGSSTRKQAKMMRTQYHYRERYDPSYQTLMSDTSMANRMRHASEYSMHPLVMMGVNPAQAGGFADPGQSDPNYLGEGIRRAGAEIGRAVGNRKMNKLAEDRMQAEIDLLKARANDLGQKPPQDPIPNMPGQNAPKGVVPNIDPATQEIKKGEVGTHKKGQGQTGTGVKPLTQGITIGNQVIQLAVEDPADIAEDPAAIIGAAVLDRANTGVQWRKAIRDYAGWAHPRDYKARNLAERVITKQILWGLAKLKKSYLIPRFMGR